MSQHSPGASPGGGPAAGHRPTGVWVAAAAVAVVFVVLLAVTVTLLVVRDDPEPSAGSTAVQSPVPPPTAEGTDPNDAPTGSAGPSATQSGTGTSVPGPDDVVLDADTDLFAFESPSGNIDCLISAGNDPPFVECDLGGVTWSVPRPADCDLDWGGGEDGSGRVSLSVDGEAGAVCAGDITVGPDAPVMVPYGQAVWLGEELVCRSSEAGMRCESLLSSSGFQVSRAAFDVF